MNFDYFYNRQSELYNFIRLPMVLMEDEIFESISIESKVLYSYMLNRMGLSYKNGWIDKDGQLKVLIDQENNLVSQDAEGIKIMNIPIGELPHTGGSGTSNYIIIGLTIIICSFILFIEKDKTLYKK